MKNKCVALVCFITAVFVSACGNGLEAESSSGAATGSYSGAPASGTPDNINGPSSAQAEILAQTNSHRASNGLAPLALNTKLSRAAQSHAEQMGTLGFFDHTSPDGSSAGDRMRTFGYNWRTWGENIAYGSSTPSAVIQGWINSSGHRANILSINFKEIGVGYFVGKSTAGKSGTAYWVQNFGAQ